MLDSNMIQQYTNYMIQLFSNYDLEMHYSFT